jgi:hypothetical protein
MGVVNEIDLLPINLRRRRRRSKQVEGRQKTKRRIKGNVKTMKSNTNKNK